MLKKCHFIGIGGIGMSGLARLVLNKKIAVSGSDIASSFVTDSLSKEGAQIFIDTQQIMFSLIRQLFIQQISKKIILNILQP